MDINTVIKELDARLSRLEALFATKTKICANRKCGKPFPITRSDKKFCNTKCKQQEYDTRNHTTV